MESGVTFSTKETHAFPYEMIRYEQNYPEHVKRPRIVPLHSLYFYTLNSLVSLVSIIMTIIIRYLCYCSILQLKKNWDSQFSFGC
jgi:hypothetical protein